MSRLMGLAFAVALLLAPADSVREKFGRYKAIEAYEVFPGVMMVPRYTPDHQVCEIGLEKLHYSTDKIRLDSDLSPQRVNQIFNELAPADERGPRSKDFGSALITQSGPGLTTETDYENVSLEVYSQQLSASEHREIVERNVVAVIRWKNRHCQ